MSTTPVALVTGASRDIGRAIAEELGRRGHAVGVGYLHSSDAAAEVVAAIGAAGGRALALRADVSRAPEVAAMLDAVDAELGPLDVLVACAGITRDTLLGASEPADF